MSCACPIMVALPYTIGCNFRRIVIFTQRRAVAVVWNWSSPFGFLYGQVSPIRFGPSALSPPFISVASHHPSLPPSLILHFQGKRVYAAIRASARHMGYFFPAESPAARSSSFFCQGPVDVDKYWPRVSDVYTFCFCLKISASLLRANDVSCAHPNRDLRSGKTYASFLFANEAALSLGFF